MLAEAHVAATPGRDFDTLAGHRFMRFSYAGSHEDMAAGARPYRTLAEIGRVLCADIEQVLADLAAEMAARTDRGEVATYIPQLTQCRSGKIRHRGRDDRRAGDRRAAMPTSRFSIQSVSKVFTLTLALGKSAMRCGSGSGASRPAIRSTHRPARAGARHPAQSVHQCRRDRRFRRLLAGHQPREAIGEILRFIQFLADDDTIYIDATSRLPSARPAFATSRSQTTCESFGNLITRRSWRSASTSTIARSR